MEETAVIIARIGEQLANIQMRLSEMEQDMKNAIAQGTKLVVLETKLEQTTSDLSKLSERLTKDFVKQEAFRPLQRIVYGAVALMLTSVLTLLLSLLKLSH